MAEQPELPGAALDELLSISRPTISYHIRILVQAGLVDVTKRGRMHYYTLRKDMLRSVLAELNSLVPDPHPTDVDSGQAYPRPPVDALVRGIERPAVPTW